MCARACARLLCTQHRSNGNHLNNKWRKRKRFSMGCDDGGLSNCTVHTYTPSSKNWVLHLFSLFSSLLTFDLHYSVVHTHSVHVHTCESGYYMHFARHDTKLLTVLHKKCKQTETEKSYELAEVQILKAKTVFRLASSETKWNFQFTVFQSFSQQKRKRILSPFCTFQAWVYEFCLLLAGLKEKMWKKFNFHTFTQKSIFFPLELKQPEKCQRINIQNCEKRTFRFQFHICLFDTLAIKIVIAELYFLYCR